MEIWESVSPLYPVLKPKRREPLGEGIRHFGDRGQIAQEWDKACSEGGQAGHRAAIQLTQRHVLVHRVWFINPIKKRSRGGQDWATSSKQGLRC